VDAIVSGPTPRGVLLPSPGFRPIPVGRSDVHRVQPGDSLAKIADGYGLSAEGLASLNGLDRAPGLQVGQVLRVPTLEAARSVASAPRQSRDAGAPRISAQYAVVVDEASGQVLWSREGNTPIAPASLTKIVTTLVTLDYARLTDLVTVRVDSRRMPGSTVMGLYPGEELTVEDLLYGLMLPSGNDAALALAEHVAGTKENFALLMNEKARSLGLSGSSFVNPHGLDAMGHLSTAHDMAMFAREGMRDPTFRVLSNTQSYSTPRGGGYRLGNLNQLLRRYDGADGVKIGFTNAAGRAIVGSAVRDGHRVYVAMMRSNDIYADSAALLDWAFSNYTWP
jgi:D-alanyl-D-alanine carboxypeptidase